MDQIQLQQIVASEGSKSPEMVGAGSLQQVPGPWGNPDWWSLAEMGEVTKHTVRHEVSGHFSSTSICRVCRPYPREAEEGTEKLDGGHFNLRCLSTS